MPPKRPKPETRPAYVFAEIALAAIIFIIIVSIIGAYLTQGFGRYLGFVDGFSRFWRRAHLIIAVIVTMLNIGLIFFVVQTVRKFFHLAEQDPLFILPAGAGPRERAVPLEREISGEWAGVRKFAESQNPSDWNMAVLQADALLDEVLQQMGHEGNTVKERLDLVDQTRFPSYDRVLSAHRLRNMIAHDPMIQHTRETISHALASYELAFRELGVLKEKSEALMPEIRNTPLGHDK